MRCLALMAVLALGACVGGPVSQPGGQGGPYPDAQPLGLPDEPAPDPTTAARNFATVVDRVEPVAERVCRERLPGDPCDFRIVVDTTPGAQPNAYQSRDSAGRPVIAFTVPLIALARNQDELAFVMGHEAAHHILAHIPRQQRDAMTSAVLSGMMTAAMGGGVGAIQNAEQMGASLGARAFSKDYELEADELGTVLAYEAGYDPVRGAAFFSRLPDPGNRFLGSHPPNAQRIEAVRRTMAALTGGA